MDQLFSRQEPDPPALIPELTQEEDDAVPSPVTSKGQKDLDTVQVDAIDLLVVNQSKGSSASGGLPTKELF